MKKLIILLFFIPLLSFGQDKVKGYVSISEEYKNLYLLNSNVMAGVSIPIGKTTLGYEVRIINVVLKNSLPSYPLGKTGEAYTLPVNYLTLQLGLSYAFDISKKKTKTEML